MMTLYISNFFDIIGYILLIFLFTPKYLRRNNKLIYLSIIVIISIQLVLLSVFSNNYVNILSNILLCSIYLFLLSRESILLKTLTVPLFIFMENLIYECAGFLLSIFLKQSAFWGTTGEQNVLYSKLLAISLLIIFMLTLYREKKYLSLTAFNKIIIILVSIGALVAVYKLEADTPFLYNLNASFYGLTYIIAVFIIYLYLYSVSEKNQLCEINHTQVQYIEALKANYDTISANETRYKKFVHDVKNHVCTIERLIELGEYQQASSYIQIFRDNVPQKENSLLETGNILFNAILLDKQRCFPHIQFQTSGKIGASLDINDYDLCTIVSNLLDNALEYCQKNNFSYIEVNLYQDDNFILFEFKNQVTQDFTMKHFGEKSTKKDSNHGLGISNVKEALSNNRGKLTYELIDGFLSCKVIISNTK